jgi:hypothetical protein
MKVFCSHAWEDKELVEHVYKRIIARFPKIEGWLDKYEIVGVDDLIEKQVSIRSLLFQSSLAR